MAVTKPTISATDSQASRAAVHLDWWAALFTFGAAILRLWGLGSRPFWFDEAFAALQARQDVPGLFALNGGDNHPVGYYLTLKFWIDIFGSSETAIRLLSVGPGVASVWLTWLIGRRLFPQNDAIPLTATLLMALSPFQIYFSQEARNYSFMQFFVLTAIWFWLRGLAHNHWADWVGLGVAGVLGIVSNFTTAFYLAALFLWPLLHWRKFYVNFAGKWRDKPLARLYLTGLGMAVIAGVALLPKLTTRLGTIKGNFWIPAPDLLVVLRTFYSFVFGVAEDDKLLAAIALSFLVLVMVLISLLPALVKNWREDNGLTQTSWLLWATIVLIIIVSLLFQSLYLDKALLACSPFYFLLLGWAIFRTDVKRRGRGLLVAAPLTIAMLLAVTVLPNLYAGNVQPLFIVRHNAELINRYLTQTAQPTDGVITATDIVWLPLEYYGPTAAPPKYPMSEYPAPNIFPLLVEKLGSQTLSRAEIDARFNRFWVIFEIKGELNPAVRSVPQPFNGNEPNWLHSVDWQKATLADFDARYQRVQATQLDNCLLVLYQKK